MCSSAVRREVHSGLPNANVLRQPHRIIPAMRWRQVLMAGQVSFLSNCNEVVSTQAERHAAFAPQRRSASAFTAGSMTLRIATIPGESNDQYRRNFLR